MTLSRYRDELQGKSWLPETTGLGLNACEGKTWRMMIASKRYGAQTRTRSRAAHRRGEGSSPLQDDTGACVDAAWHMAIDSKQMAEAQAPVEGAESLSISRAAIKTLRCEMDRGTHPASAETTCLAHRFCSLKGATSTGLHYSLHIIHSYEPRGSLVSGCEASPSHDTTAVYYRQDKQTCLSG